MVWGQAAAMNGDGHPPGFSLKPVPSAQANVADDGDYPPGFCPTYAPPALAMQVLRLPIALGIVYSASLSDHADLS